jgi:hypothetical protein
MEASPVKLTLALSRNSLDLLTLNFVPLSPDAASVQDAYGNLLAAITNASVTVS